jgi:hypothetical protein
VPCRTAVAIEAFILDHAFTEDDEADVADDRDAAPGNGCCPEGGVIGDLAGYGGKVWMGGREEVECYLW